MTTISFARRVGGALVGAEFYYVGLAEFEIAGLIAQRTPEKNLDPVEKVLPTALSAS